MIKVEVRDSRLQAAFKAAEAKLRSTLPLMREIAGIMLDEVEQNFDANGRPGWAPLKPSTVKRRAKRGKGPEPILQDSGRLVRSNTPAFEEGRASITNNVAYAAIQQLGGTITLHPRSSLFAQKRTKAGKFTKGREKEIRGGKGKSTFGLRTITIPARPFLRLTEGGIQKILAAARFFFSLSKP